VRRKNAGHVRVKVGLLAAETNVRFRETDHEVAIEGPEYLAPGVVGDHEGDIRLSIEVAVAPDFAGDLDTAAELVEGVEWADGDIGGHGDSATISYQFSVLSSEKSKTQRLGAGGGARPTSALRKEFLVFGCRRKLVAFGLLPEGFHLGAGDVGEFGALLARGAFHFAEAARKLR